MRAPISVLLVDGPKDGELFACHESDQAIELFASDTGQILCRYKIGRFQLGRETYAIAAVDADRLKVGEVVAKIRQAQLQPLQIADQAPAP